MRSSASVTMLAAVSKPRQPSVPQTSLSIVFGMATTAAPRFARPAATERVSSPPMTTSASSPRLLIDASAASSPPSRLSRFVRLDPIIVPPRVWMPRTSLRSSGRVSVAAGFASPAQPSMIPTTLCPPDSARRTTARIAGLSPGQSPPPVRTPIRSRLESIAGLIAAALSSSPAVPACRTPRHSRSRASVPSLAAWRHSRARSSQSPPPCRSRSLASAPSPT